MRKIAEELAALPGGLIEVRKNIMTRAVFKGKFLCFMRLWQ
jgi:hypothetical protein